MYIIKVSIFYFLKLGPLKKRIIKLGRTIKLSKSIYTKTKWEKNQEPKRKPTKCIKKPNNTRHQVQVSNNIISNYTLVR